MRKNINKIVAIGIGLTIMSGSIIPVFAAETNKNISTSTLTNESNSIDLNNRIINGQTASEKQILTLDKAITATIANSDKLALKSKQLKLYRNKMTLQETTNDFYDSINQKVYDFPYDKLEIQEKQTKQSKDFTEDQIANDITNKYNAIILKEMDINKLKRNVDIKNKELNTMKTKKTIGMATSNQLYDKQIEINTLQDDIKAKENSLKNNMDYFEVITDLNLSNYTLDQTINYNVFKINGSIDEYLDKKIDKYLKYNDKLMDLTKDYFDELKDDGIKDVLDKKLTELPDKSTFFKSDDTGKVDFNSGGYALSLMQYQQEQQKYLAQLNGYGSYLDGKYSLDESKVKLDDTKKNLKNGLKESYSTLLDLENKINRLNDQVKSTNTKLRYAKSKVDIGLMTENDYKAQILKSEDLDTSLRNLINTYNTLKNSIDKPWVLSSN